ncbi:MAG: serine/threonine-protein kinase [Verrucomicrobiota bacterium]
MNFFNRMFSKQVKPAAKPESIARETERQPNVSDAECHFKPGHIVAGHLKVHKIAGTGGFGVVYVVTDENSGGIGALKALHPRLLVDQGNKEKFERELMLWVRLGGHPHIVSARSVLPEGAQLVVFMDYVAPDHAGRITLQDHLNLCNDPLAPEAVLKWAIQFCHALEHAAVCGIGAHRDIKPANILVDHKGDLRVSDFGLATAGSATPTPAMMNARGSMNSFVVVQSDQRMICGTPGYIAPEIFRGEAADARSDMFSFGLVLWQLARGSRSLPYPPLRGNDMLAYLKLAYDIQAQERIPRIDGKLGQIVALCLRASPNERPQNFKELRGRCEALLREMTGATYELPSRKHVDISEVLNAAQSYLMLSQHERALQNADRAIQMDAANSRAWAIKGTILFLLTRFEEADTCFQQALNLDSEELVALGNRPYLLIAFGRQDEAMKHLDQLLKLSPMNPVAWLKKGELELEWEHGTNETALKCFERSLQLNPNHQKAWSYKGDLLRRLGRNQEAVVCYDEAVVRDPHFIRAWMHRGISLSALGQTSTAVESFKKALDLDSNDAVVWFNLGVTLHGAKNMQEAFACFDRCVNIDPTHVDGWFNLAAVYAGAGRLEKAIEAFDRVLSLNPKHPTAAGFRKQCQDALQRKLGQ